MLLQATSIFSAYKSMSNVSSGKIEHNFVGSLPKFRLPNESDACPAYKEVQIWIFFWEARFLLYHTYCDELSLHWPDSSFTCWHYCTFFSKQPTPSLGGSSSCTSSSFSQFVHIWHFLYVFQSATNRHESVTLNSWSHLSRDCEMFLSSDLLYFSNLNANSLR